MKKYSSLSNYLSGLTAGEIQLTFSSVEEIIEGQLPPSAMRYPAWWSNEKEGTHKWAHLWQAAGWVTDGVDLKLQTVTFRRVKQEIQEILLSLRPTTLETIFDILGLAKISTEDWSTKADGQPVKNLKANPNFCYNWSFGSLREGHALCIWHETLQIQNECIVFTENLRKHAAQLQAAGHNSANSEARKRRSLTQAIRARAFDEVLNVSYARGIPVSVILSEGNRLTRDELGEGSSHVHRRFLDPVSWYVHKYDDSTGECSLVRGVKPKGSDNGDDPESEEAGRPDDVQLRAITIRRGQGKFREQLLAAYRRTCAISGCKIVDLLEAAHIRPHAEEPNYSVTNGLLLRADLHTLFDLGLLAVDTKRRIRLAPSLLFSEYKIYDGRELRQPEYPSEMPSSEALERHYTAFQKKHCLQSR